MQSNARVGAAKREKPTWQQWDEEQRQLVSFRHLKMVRRQREMA